MTIKLHVVADYKAIPSPPTPWSMKELSSMKLGLGSKKVGDCCYRLME